MFSATKKVESKWVQIKGQTDSVFKMDATLSNSLDDVNIVFEIVVFE